MNECCRRSAPTPSTATAEAPRRNNSPPACFRRPTASSRIPPPAAPPPRPSPYWRHCDLNSMQRCRGASNKALRWADPACSKGGRKSAMVASPPFTSADSLCKSCPGCLISPNSSRINLPLQPRNPFDTEQSTKTTTLLRTKGYLSRHTRKDCAREFRALGLRTLRSQSDPSDGHGSTPHHIFEEAHEKPRKQISSSSQGHDQVDPPIIAGFVAGHIGRPRVIRSHDKNGGP